jgi:hypothetical protein
MHHHKISYTLGSLWGGGGALSQSLVTESSPEEAHVGWLLGKGIQIKLILGTDDVYMGCVIIGSRLLLLSIRRESMFIPIQNFVLSMSKIALFKTLFHKLLIVKIFHFSV